MIRKPVFFAATVTFLTVLMGCGQSYTPGSLAESVDTAVVRIDESTVTMPDGVSIHVETVGSGPPVIVVHGGPGLPPPEPWPTSRELSRVFTFVHFDQRGSGRSSRPVASFSRRSWRNNAEILTDALGVEAQIADIERLRILLKEETVRVVGHSYGAFLAALYAAEFPSRVDRLVLIAPAAVLVMPNKNDGLFAAIEAHLPESMVPEYREWREDYFNYRVLWNRTEEELATLSNGMGRFYAVMPTSAEWGYRAANDPALTGGWIQPAVYLSLGRRYDVREFLGRITAATTIFVGTEDFVPPAGGAYRDAIPGAQLVELPGCGHFPQDDPSRFALPLARALGTEL